MRPAQLLVLCAALAGCKSPARPAFAGLPVEAEDRARAAGLSVEEIEAARKTYVARCARCHKFYDPADYTDDEWRTWMTKMSKKARLRADQEQLLSRYLETFRESSKPAPVKRHSRSVGGTRFAASLNTGAMTKHSPPGESSASNNCPSPSGRGPR